jgi:hypothetical protein
MLTTTRPLTVRVALPSNISRIEKPADMLLCGVRQVTYKFAADEAEAVALAGNEPAFLFWSVTACQWIVFFPAVEVTPYVERKK